MRVRLTLRHLGGDFAGWQRQPDGGGVQNLLEARLADLYGAVVLTTGSGRTDAGVHAGEQVAVFDTPPSSPALPLEGLVIALNHRLPASIRIVRAEEAPADWSPRHGARVRHYRYRFADKRHREACPPLLHDRVWNCPHAVDPARMEEALTPLLGAHDFTTFCSARDPSAHKVRELFDRRCWRQDGLVILDLWANAFLRNMVRSIAGNLVHVLRHGGGSDGMARLLAARDPSVAKRRAPPEGLSLERVFYAPLFGDRAYYRDAPPSPSVRPDATL